MERDRKLETIYSRVNRRPTPHKKRNKSRHGEGVAVPPPIPPYTDDRQVLVQDDHLERCEYTPPLLLYARPYFVHGTLTSIDHRIFLSLI
jgi:hypothetical protein